jgi:hypothetical protein
MFYFPCSITLQNKSNVEKEKENIIRSKSVVKSQTIFCRTFLEPGWVSNQKRKQKIFNEQK